MILLKVLFAKWALQLVLAGAVVVAAIGWQLSRRLRLRLSDWRRQRRLGQLVEGRKLVVTFTGRAKDGVTERYTAIDYPLAEIVRVVELTGAPMVSDARTPANVGVKVALYKLGDGR